jgi:hypothetical protein
LFETTRSAVLLVCRALSAADAIPFRLKRKIPGDALPPKTGSQAPCHPRAALFPEKYGGVQANRVQRCRQSLPVAAVRALLLRSRKSPLQR